MRRLFFIAWVALSAGVVPAQDATAAAAVQALEEEGPGRRAAWQQAQLIARWQALAETLTAPEAQPLRLRVAAALAELAPEQALLQKLGDAQALAGKPPAAVLPALQALTLSPLEQLALARLSFLVGAVAAGETALAAARDGDAALKDVTDEVLARARGVDVPPGGFHRYRGVFLPLAERDRAQSIDAALEALHGLQLGGVVAPVPLEPGKSAAPAFVALGGRGPDALLAAADTVRAALRADYADVRGWLISYARDPALRTQLQQHRAKVLPIQQAAMQLIARYDKPEQGKVDEYRAQLEGLYEQGRTFVRRDLQALAKVRPEAAYALLLRVRARETALAAVHACLLRERPPGLPAVMLQPDKGADVSWARRLPGREQSELEDVLWCTVHFAALQLRDCMARIDELQHHQETLTPWESTWLFELQHSVVDALNARIATSLDAEELRFVQAENHYRAVLGLRPFELEERCNVAARRHSQEMVDLGYFGHMSPVPRNHSPGDRVHLEGYGGGVGENCFAGSGDGVAAFEAWYHSPGHHRNLVSGGIHLGVGCARGTGMWTMVCGGADLTWRSLHKDQPPARAQALAAMALDLRQGYASEPKTKAEQAQRVQLRERVRSEMPDVLPALARVAFGATEPRSPEHAASAELLALLVEPELTPDWRALQLAAVAASIELAQGSPQPAVRARALSVVAPLVDKLFGLDVAADAAGRRLCGEQLRVHWQDEAQWRFRVNAAPVKRVARPVVPGGDGPSAQAKRRVLSKPERLNLAKKHGGGTRTEQALEAALAFLAKLQDDDGAFRGRSFMLHDRRFTVETAGPGAQEWDVALTGLVVLAFATAGYCHDQGDYRDVLRRAAGFLGERIGDYGRFDTAGSHYMYAHAIATQALCELYGNTADPAIGATAQAAVNFLVYAQHAQSGGWRYEANERGDTSVTGWVLMALNAAYKTDLPVAGFRDAMRFFDGVTSSGYYQVGYTDALRPGEGENLRLTAVGMTCRFFLGQTADNPRIKLPSYRLLEHLPTAQGEPDFYYWYYGSLALFQIGGDSWKKWNTALLDGLLPRQVEDKGSVYRGSWPPQGPWSDQGGRIYQTAMAALMLTTYYRYDRAPKSRIHAFTGDLMKDLEPYLAVLRSAADERDKLLAERRMVERFGGAAGVPFLRLLAARQEPLDLRLRLARCLPGVAQRQHATMLIALLTDPDAGIADAAAQALALVCTAEQAGDLRQALRSGHRGVRVFAARALAQLGIAAAATDLADCLGHEADGGVRAEFEAALRRLAHRSALQELLQLALGDGEGQLAVAEALDVLQAGELGRMLPALSTREPKLWFECVAAVKSYREAAALPLLLVLFDSDTAAVRTQAAKLFAALSGWGGAFPAEDSADERKRALVELRKWWKEHQSGFIGR